MHRCCLSLFFCDLCSRELRRQVWVGLLMVFLEGVETASVVRCSKRFASQQIVDLLLDIATPRHGDDAQSTATR